MSQEERELLERIERKLDALEQKIGALNMPPRALTFRDAGRMLGRSAKTVRRMVASRELRTVTIAKSEMIPMSEVIRVVAVRPAERPAPAVKRGPKPKPQRSAKDEAAAIRALTKRR